MEHGGNHVVVDYGNGIAAMYAHLHPNTITVKVGDEVDYGQVLAKVGNTGNSYGAHLHFAVKKNGSYGGVDSSEYINPDNPRPTSNVSAGIENSKYTFKGRNQQYYKLTNEQVKIFEAVIIGEGGTNPESVFWTASAMFNRIDSKFYGDTQAMKILTRGWSEVYNNGKYKNFLNQTDKVDSVVRAVINGNRAHKYTDFACNAPGYPLADRWIANNPGEKYEWFKGNMYCRWIDSLN